MVQDFGCIYNVLQIWHMIQAPFFTVTLAAQNLLHYGSSQGHPYPFRPGQQYGEGPGFSSSHVAQVCLCYPSIIEWSCVAASSMLQRQFRNRRKVQRGPKYRHVILDTTSSQEIKLHILGDLLA